MPQLFKNTASQTVSVFAFADAGHATLDPGEPVTGDAANITAQTALDGGALGASNDTNPAEVDATKAPGYYEFDATQAETNGDKIAWYPKSSTAGVQVKTVGGDVQTLQPPNWPSAGIESDGHVHGDVKEIEGNAVQSSNGELHVRDSDGNTMVGVSQAMTQGTAQSGTGTSITLASGESSQNQIFRDQAIRIIGGTGQGQARIITGYNGNTKVADVDEAWTVNPDATSKYEIDNGKAILAQTDHAGATVPTVTDVTNGVTVSTNNDKTGYALTSGERDSIATALLDLADGIESGVTLRQGLRLKLAALVGKVSGAATTTVTIRDTNDGTDRIVATVDADGNRTSVVLDPS